MQASALHRPVPRAACLWERRRSLLGTRETETFICLAGDRTKPEAAAGLVADTALGSGASEAVAAAQAPANDRRQRGAGLEVIGVMGDQAPWPP